MRAANEVITSGSNPKIKRLLELEKDAAERRGSGLFVVEGLRETRRCLEGGFEIESIFICPEIMPEEAKTLPTEEAKVFEVSSKVYEKIAYRAGTEGIVAEAREKEHSLSSLHLSPRPLVAVLESVEKPGNIGAVLRSCDAVGADALLLCDPLTDLYNPNLIRASLGAVFTVQCAVCSSEEAVSFLKENGIQILTAQLQDSSQYYDCDMTPGTAIVMGTESTGLTPTWRKAADAHIKIPMMGKLDSLNVSVSAAVLLFEALRQRING